MYGVLKKTTHDHTIHAPHLGEVVRDGCPRVGRVEEDDGHVAVAARPPVGALEGCLRVGKIGRKGENEQVRQPTLHRASAYPAPRPSLPYTCAYLPYSIHCLNLHQIRSCSKFEKINIR